jgi:biotin carboxyl carrier protein
MEFEFEVGGSIHRVGLEFKDGRYRVRLGERQLWVDTVKLSPNAVSLIIDGAGKTVYLAKDGNRRYLAIDGEVYSIQKAETAKKTDGKEEKKEEEIIKTPMPGLVVKLAVKEGDVVDEGQVVAIVEAMKMENSVRASMKSIVKKVYVSEGSKVEFGAALVELKRI